MLLKKENGRRLSAMSLCLAMTFAPLFTAFADEPELVPSDSTATPAEQAPVLLNSGAQSSAMASLVGTQPLAEGRRRKAAPIFWLRYLPDINLST